MLLVSKTMSSFPIRCFTCGKVISSLWEAYCICVEDGEDSYKVLDELKVGRVCCRRMFTTHVDIDRFQDMYPTYIDGIQRIGPKHKAKEATDDLESSSEEHSQNIEEEREDENSEDECEPED